MAQVCCYSRGRAGGTQAAQGHQPEAEGLGWPPRLEELRRFHQLPGDISGPSDDSRWVFVGCLSLAR